MRFEGQTAVNIKATVFWDVMPFNFVLVPVFWKNPPLLCSTLKMEQ